MRTILLILGLLQGCQRLPAATLMFDYFTGEMQSNLVLRVYHCPDITVAVSNWIGIATFYVVTPPDGDRNGFFMASAEWGTVSPYDITNSFLPAPQLKRLEPVEPKAGKLIPPPTTMTGKKLAGGGRRKANTGRGNKIKDVIPLDMGAPAGGSSPRKTPPAPKL